MALLEVHDTIDITDFSRLTRGYRLEKEERKQEWANVEADFVSAGPRPEKEGSGVKVASHSAAPEELRDSEAHGSEDGDADNARSESHQSSSSSFGRGHPLSAQQSIADNESDFSSKNQDLYSNNDARTPESDDLGQEQTVNWDDGHFGDPAMAGLNETKKVKKAKKVEVWDYEGFTAALETAEDAETKAQEEQVVGGDDGDLGSTVSDWTMDLQKAEKARMETEEEQAVALDGGGFSADSDVTMSDTETEWMKEMREIKAAKAAKQAKKAKESKKAAKQAKKAKKLQEMKEAKEPKKAKKAKEVKKVKNWEDGWSINHP